MDEAGLEAGKVQYYKYLVRFYIQEKEMLEAAKAYQIIYDSLKKAESDDKLIMNLDDSGKDRKSSFQNFALYLLVASYNQEKVDLLNKIEKDYARELDQEPTIAKFVRKVLTFELMPMDEKEIESQLV